MGAAATHYLYCRKCRSRHTIVGPPVSDLRRRLVLLDRWLSKHQSHHEELRVRVARQPRE